MSTDDRSASAAPFGDGTSWAGRRFEVTVGPIAHGGHCVARHDGRVIFVRHSLPGERVEVLITDDGGGRFCRGDAVAVLAASPDRVEPPCRHAHPGGCGGCDFQHVEIGAQRRLKAAVVAEQLQRLAGLEVDVEVQALSPTPLGWRRRIRYAGAPDGRLGLRAHRSHRIVPIDQCLIGAAGVGDPNDLSAPRPGIGEVELTVDDDGAVVGQVRRRRRSRPQARQGRSGHAARAGRDTDLGPAERERGPQAQHYRVGDHQFVVTAGGFWQIHPQAAAAFTTAVLTGLAPAEGDRVLDLYAGAGLFTVPIADQVGPTGAVIGLEADRAAVADGQRNLTPWPWARMQRGAVSAERIARAIAELGGVDAVVLDPPRTGAGRDVMTSILTSGASRISYVACDPAALARDLATALAAGWIVADLVAFDAFPMTQHVECVATLRAG